MTVPGTLYGENEMLNKFIKHGSLITLVFLLFVACDTADILILDPGSEGGSFSKSLQFKIAESEQQSIFPDKFSATRRILVPHSTTRTYQLDVEKDNNGYFWVSQPVEAPLQRNFTLSMTTKISSFDWIGFGSYRKDIQYNNIVELYLFEATAEFAGGAGTIVDPYLVASADHLNRVRNYKDAHFRQVANIDLGVSPWKDGSGDHTDNRPPFTGVYDGDSFRIMNLSIQDSTLNTAALFGWTREAELKNIFLDNVNVRGAWAVGALSEINERVIQIVNCHSTGAVHGNEAVGGLIGTMTYTSGVFLVCVLEKSYATGSVIASVSNAGGLVPSNSGGTIQNCYAMGNVSAPDYCGGPVAYSGWDFNTIWIADTQSTINSGYPALRFL